MCNIYVSLVTLVVGLVFLPQKFGPLRLQEMSGCKVTRVRVVQEHKGGRDTRVKGVWVRMFSAKKIASGQVLMTTCYI